MVTTAGAAACAVTVGADALEQAFPSTAAINALACSMVILGCCCPFNAAIFAVIGDAGTADSATRGLDAGRVAAGAGMPPSSPSSSSSSSSLPI